jgi:hypothetical protein
MRWKLHRPPHDQSNLVWHTRLSPIQKMRETVLVEATRLGIAVRLEEIGDTDSLSRINPLSLPCLYVSDELIASQNPIKVGVTV